MPTILIIGADTGLGLEFARQYASDGWQVIAANRTPFTPKDFASLDHDTNEFHYDALDDASALELAKHLRGRPIDVLLFNVGLATDEDLGPEDITPEHWQPIMLTNTYAPLKLAGLLEPNLRAGEQKVLAAISSLAGSMSEYAFPRQFAYRASKAALNQLWRNLSVDWREWGCKCILLSPSWPRAHSIDFSADITPQQSVSGMRMVIANMSLERSGLHWGYDGQTIPW